jgi:tetratricopeptide (TPR) repeat protein
MNHGIEDSRRNHLIIYVSLAVAIAAVYSSVRHFGFVGFDDDLYITGNAQLRGGMTFGSLTWAFTTPLDQWMPVTWLVRLIEYRWFGLDAGAHHLVNVLFHAANTLLLLGILNRMTRAFWRSAMVAALFALHPLHVEPVVWVTGLKDVLSMFFGLLTIWAYVRCVGRDAVPRVRSWPRGSAALPCSSAWHIVTLCLFALALMSKPMMVTLPFVLLLLDYWPLGRTRWAEPAAGQRAKSTWRELLTEKLPFVSLAAASCVVTLWAQRAAGALASLERVPLGRRIANALLSYGSYLGKAFCPTGLAVFYPLDTNVSLATGMVACVGLVAVTVVVIWIARREAWLATGWFWYLGTLVPVIGLVQVGSQAMADRYTYFPLVGLFIMVCWSVPDSAMQRRIVKATVRAAAIAGLAVCAVLTKVQVGYWKNSETLFRHALNVTRNNWLAHNNLGMALKSQKQYDRAVEQFRAALRCEPNYLQAHINLGFVLAVMGKYEEALEHLQQSVRLRPNSAEAHNNLGVALVMKGSTEEAIAQFSEALRIRPDYADAADNLRAAREVQKDRTKPSGTRVEVIK